MACPNIKLNNGVEIPFVGLGTWQSPANEVTAAVEYALKEAGYRHIDCAWSYGNEKEVGEGIRRSGVPRSEIFITSKIWATRLHEVEKALDESLTALGVDYLDLYLIHWPIHLNPTGNDARFPTLPNGHRDVVRDWPLRETWKQMEAVVKNGKVRAIGVSNVSQRILEEEILPYAEIIPAVDQCEIHLYNPQHKLVSYLQSKGIVPQAYSPLGSTGSPLFKDETVTALAEHYGLQTSDILLGYLVAKNFVILPKSVNPARIKNNMDGALAAAKKLTPEDIEKLNGVSAAGKQLRVNQPPWGVDLGFENWPVRFQ